MQQQLHFDSCVPDNVCFFIPRIPGQSYLCHTLEGCPVNENSALTPPLGGWRVGGAGWDCLGSGAAGDVTVPLEFLHRVLC